MGLKVIEVNGLDDNAARWLKSRWVALCAIVIACVSLAGEALALNPEQGFDQYDIATWTMAEGLPEVGANPITQDHHGYLWIGTMGGLSRFDGRRFVNYTPENTPALPGGWVRSLLVDRSGRLWIGTSQGVVVRKDGTFDNAPFNDRNNPPAHIRKMLLDAQGRLLITASNGVYRYDDNAGLKLIAPLTHVMGILESAEGLWLSNDDGLYLLRGDNLQRMPHPGSSTRSSRFIQVADQLWMANDEGLFKRTGETWQRHADPRLANTGVTKLLLDKDGVLWLLAGEKIIRLRDAKYLDSYQIGPTTSSNDLFEDRAGNIWLSKTGDGITRFSNGVAHNYLLQGNHPVPLIWTNAVDSNGHIITGGREGLARLNNGKLEIFESSPPLPQVIALLQSGKTLWIGTTDGVLTLIDGQLSRPPTMGALRNTLVHGFRYTRDNALWIWTNQGVYKQGADQTLVHIKQLGAQTPSTIRALIQRRDGSLLASGDEGIFEVVGDQLVSMPFPRKNTTVSAMLELPGGQLLVSAHASSGLYAFHNGRWTHLGVDRGMPPYSAYDLSVDSNEVLWISGQQGVYSVPTRELVAALDNPARRIHPSLLITTDSRKLGGQQLMCCSGAATNRGFFHDGKFWAPHPSGILSIPIERAFREVEAPSAYVERVRIGSTWHPANSSPSNAPKGARDVAFEFNALARNLTAPVSIQYRLQGYDTEWQQHDDSAPRTTAYTNLPPGNYVFQVEARLSNGAEAALAQTTLVIPAYFNETTQFRLLLLVGALLILWLSLYLKGRAYQRRQKSLHLLVDERTRQLSEANEHLALLSRTDPLTDLSNRRHVEEQIASRYSQTPPNARHDDAGKVTLFLLLDIDNFKSINDEHGHDAGDAVLRELARRLRTQMRPGDFSARWGGEEFLLVFNDTLRDRHAAIANRLRDSIIGETFAVGEERLEVTISIGMAELPAFPDQSLSWTWEHSLRLADMALYSVKNDGRDGAAIYVCKEGGPMPTTGMTAQAAVDAGIFELQKTASPPVL